MQSLHYNYGIRDCQSFRAIWLSSYWCPTGTSTPNAYPSLYRSSSFLIPIFAPVTNTRPNPTVWKCVIILFHILVLILHLRRCQGLKFLLPLYILPFHPLYLCHYAIYCVIYVIYYVIGFSRYVSTLISRVQQNPNWLVPYHTPHTTEWYF